MKLKEGFVLRELGSEYIVCPEGVEVLDFGKMFSLNETAAFVWRRMQRGPFELRDLVAALLEEYDVSESLANEDVKALVAQLSELGIIDE